MFLRRRFAMELGPLLAPLGASPAMYGVLAHLLENGKTPQYDLANDAAFDAPSLSRLVSKMVKDGLVKREVDPNDKRVRLLTITNKGERLERSLSTIIADVAQRLTSHFTVEEQQTLFDLLDRLVSRMPPPEDASVEHLKQMVAEADTESDD